MLAELKYHSTFEYRKHSLHCPTNVYQTQWHCWAISVMFSAEMYTCMYICLHPTSYVSGCVL